LILDKIAIIPGKNSFTYTVGEFPIKAGIDLYNKMIDRIPDDNLIAVEEIAE
jgi:hypothetical protein